MISINYRFFLYKLNSEATRERVQAVLGRARTVGQSTKGLEGGQGCEQRTCPAVFQAQLFEIIFWEFIGRFLSQEWQ